MYFRKYKEYFSKQFILNLFLCSTGNAITFLKYNCSIIEVAKLQISIVLGGKTVDEVKEEMRLR